MNIVSYHQVFIHSSMKLPSSNCSSVSPFSTKAFFFFLAEANVSRQIHQSGTAPELSEVCPTVHASGVGASDQLAPGEGIPISSASPTA